MKKITTIFSRVFLLLAGCATQNQIKAQPSQQNIQQHFEHSLAVLHNKNPKEILVAAHRADWRGAPENSIQALKNSIEMGADIAEMDIGITKDGQLVVMHDKTINRTTTGTGRPEDYTLAEIRKFYLRKGHGVASAHIIPTFEEYMLAAKGKILVNVDKCDGHYAEVYNILQKTGTLKQALVKTYYSLEESTRVNTLALMKKFVFMPIMDLDKPDAARQFAQFRDAVHPYAYELVFKKDTSAFLNHSEIIKKTGAKIWINALWPKLNAGHDDDKAVEENKPDETWGWIIAHGADIIQTDRPKELLLYLKKKGLHP